MKSKSAIIASIASAILLLGVAAFLFCPPFQWWLFMTFNDDWFPFMDDGPYKGVTLEAPPAGKPVDSVKVNDDWTLVVYDKGKDPAPTMALLDKNDKPLWCIMAVPGDDPKAGTNNEVRSIDVMNVESRRKSDAHYRISGVVDWTYGSEGMNCYLNKDGSLHSYYFSW